MVCLKTCQLTFAFCGIDTASMEWPARTPWGHTPTFGCCAHVYAPICTSAWIAGGGGADAWPLSCAHMLLEVPQKLFSGASPSTFVAASNCLPSLDRHVAHHGVPGYLA